MALPIVRIGDINAAGGIALIPRPTVFSSMVPLAQFASLVSPHPCCGGGPPGCDAHCVAIVVSTGTTVLAEMLPVHKAFADIDNCAHPRVTGDPTVLVMG